MIPSPGLSLALIASVYGVMSFLFTKLSVGIVLIACTHAASGDAWAPLLAVPGVLSLFVAMESGKALSENLKAASFR